MLNTLIVATAIGVVQGQQARPLFPQLFPAPTGQNALEYYVQAYDFAKRNGQRLADAFDLQNPDKSVLQWQLELTNKGGEILALVQRGNRLPFSHAPQMQEIGFVVPKELSKILMQYAELQFAYGNPNPATDTLLAVLEMSDKWRGSNVPLAIYVAAACDSIALAAFHKNYSSISLNGAERILKAVTVPEPDLSVAIWKLSADSIARTIIDPKSAQQDDATDVIDLVAMSQAQRNALLERWEATSLIVVDRMKRVFALPEQKWTDELGGFDAKRLSGDANVQALLDSVRPKNLIAMIVSWRTRHRLLRVHALIAQARWTSGSIPTSLEALPAEARLDPTSGGAYAYRKTSPSGYDLYSPGNRYWGDIRLKIDSANMPRIGG